MVIAKFKLTEDGALTMRVNGHAKAGPKGYDAVCAGASMFAFAVAQCVKNMAEEGKLAAEPSVDVGKPGRVAVSCVPKQEHFGEAVHLFNVAQVGYHLLAEAYPDHARLIPLETSLADASK